MKTRKAKRSVKRQKPQNPIEPKYGKGTEVYREFRTESGDIFELVAAPWAVTLVMNNEPQTVEAVRGIYAMCVDVLADAKLRGVRPPKRIENRSPLHGQRRRPPVYTRPGWGGDGPPAG